MIKLWLLLGLASSFLLLWAVISILKDDSRGALQYTAPQSGLLSGAGLVTQCVIAGHVVCECVPGTENPPR
jgi:hypothetical protein